MADTQDDRDLDLDLEGPTRGWEVTRQDDLQDLDEFVEHSPMEDIGSDGPRSGRERHSLLPPSLGVRRDEAAGFKSVREPTDPKFDILKTQIKQRFGCMSRCAGNCMCCCAKNTINNLKWEEPLFSFDDCFGNQDLKNQRISLRVMRTGPLVMS